MHLGVLEGKAVPAPLVEPVLLIYLKTSEKKGGTRHFQSKHQKKGRKTTTSGCACAHPMEPLLRYFRSRDLKRLQTVTKFNDNIYMDSTKARLMSARSKLTAS